MDGEGLSVINPSIIQHNQVLEDEEQERMKKEGTAPGGAAASSSGTPPPPSGQPPLPHCSLTGLPRLPEVPDRREEDGKSGIKKKEMVARDRLQQITENDIQMERF